MEETMEQALENAETAESTGEAVSALADGIGTVFRDYLSEPLLKLLGVALILLAGAIVLKIALHIVRKALNRSPLDDMIHSFVIKGIKVVYLILMIMTVFGYLGIPMTPFITMLGACGAAVALALKDSLGNFAGGILLILHQPFKKGDFIECGGYVGRVVEISLLYTYLDATGKTVAIPNGVLANQTMVNYSNSENRRIECQFGISYGSDIDRAKEIIRSIIDGSEYFRTGMAPSVGVTEHGDSAVIISAYVWCSNDDYYNARYYLMEEVKKAFDREGIEIPFPQVTVHTGE